ncbi:MAG: family 43 glycosylhydrolase [Acutalibacteraceae bacterium]|nr:family 43 glycosylhydrolase [Acutalibacteraceae bacterium]
MKILIRILSVLMCLVLTAGIFTGCSKEKHKKIDGLLEDYDYYVIRNKASGLVLAADDFGMAEGAKVKMRKYDAKEQDLSMIWRVVAVDSYSYRLQNMATEDRYLSVKRDSKKNGAIMCLNTLGESDGQIFELEADEKSKDDKSYRVFSRLTDFCLEPQDGISDEETDAIQNYLPYGKDVDYQVWEFERVGDGNIDLPQMISVSGDTQHWSCPEIYNYDGTYYGFIMSTGIAIKTSKDLREWAKSGTVFPTSKPLAYEWMSNPVTGVEGGSIWAPGIYKIGDTYCVYYCISTSGSQNSLIGLATNTTLDPKDKDYKWVDKGCVLHSYTGEDYNAIDPNVIIDDDGQPWLVYGSYWSGIKMRKINKETLMLDEEETTRYDLAAAQTRNGPEAGYMIKHGDYYYLFVACGSFSTGYWNGVGRSKSVTGPFLDADGNDMMRQGATAVNSYRDGFTKCGHSSVMTDSDGSQYHVTEYFKTYDDGSSSPSLLSISQLYWTEDGWPVTATTPGVLDKLSKKK